MYMYIYTQIYKQTLICDSTMTLEVHVTPYMYVYMYVCIYIYIVTNSKLKDFQHVHFFLSKISMFDEFGS